MEQVQQLKGGMTSLLLAKTAMKMGVCINVILARYKYSSQ